MPRYIDADKLHYKRIHFYDIKDGECSGLKSAVVVFADEIDKNKKARVSHDEVRGKGKWIPFTTRPMTEEERKQYSEQYGYDIEYEEAVIYTSELPDDLQEILVCNKWGHVWIDTFLNDPDYGVSLEENGDMDGVIGWMPKPKPMEVSEDA